MNASAPGDRQLTSAGPAGSAQVAEPGTADRPRGITSSRTRHPARFADLLDGLVDENAAEGKLKRSNAAADQARVAYPFLPPEPRNESVRSPGLALTLDSMHGVASEDATAPAPVPFREAGVADFAPAPLTAQPNPDGQFGHCLTAESFAALSAPDSEQRGPQTNAAVCQDVPPLQEFAQLERLGKPQAAAAGMTPDGHTEANQTTLVLDSRAPGSPAHLLAGERSTATVDTSQFPEGWLRGTEVDETDPPISRRPNGDGPDADAFVSSANPDRASVQKAAGGRPAKLAFAARIVPLPAGEAINATQTDERVQEANPPKPNAGHASGLSASGSSGDQKEDSPDQALVADRVPAIDPRVASLLTPAGSGQPPALPAEVSERAEPAPPQPRQTGLTEDISVAPAAPARQIQLQFHQGEQRVDVRLTERNGEVQVAVRTPDPHLAGALRADLPALSTRLEQTGFRAETWHPALFHDSARPAGHASPSFSDASGTPDRSRHSGQQPPEPRQQRSNTAHPAKSQRKEFRWFLSQHR